MGAPRCVEKHSINLLSLKKDLLGKSLTGRQPNPLHFPLRQDNENWPILAESDAWIMGMSSF